MIDLSTLDTTAAGEAGAAIEILHPTTGERLGITIHVVGVDSPSYRAAQRKVAQKRLAKRAHKLDLEEVESEGLALLASCTRGWSGVRVDGNEVPFSEAAAVELYTRFPWIKEQIDAGMADRANFLPKPSPTSPPPSASESA